MAEDSPTSAHKQCSRCGELLPSSGYYRDRRTKSGFRSDCKACVRSRVLRYQRENAETYRAYQLRWRTKNKQTTLVYATEYRTTNAEKVRADMEQYRSEPRNRQVARERTQAWRNNPGNRPRRLEHHRRRTAAKKSATIGLIAPEQLAAKFAYWGNRCWMCREARRLQVDHVKPLSKGGAHVLSNIRPACGPCNRAKSARWPLPAR